MNEKYISIPQVPMNKLQLADKKGTSNKVANAHNLGGKILS